MTGSERFKKIMNGEKVDEAPSSAPQWTLPTNGAKYLVLGGDATHASYDGTSFTKCKLSDVSIYSTALTDAEVRARYQSLKN